MHINELFARLPVGHQAATWRRSNVRHALACYADDVPDRKSVAALPLL